MDASGADTEELSRKLAIKTPVRCAEGGQPERRKPAEGGARQSGCYAGSEVLIFDEPTVGIDIGAKSEIYRMMDELACQGKVVIMISSDNPELVAVSDRVGVMRNGRIDTILEGNASPRRTSCASRWAWTKGKEGR